MEIKKHGFKVIANLCSIVLHKVGVSNLDRAEYFYNNVRNRLTFSRYLCGKIAGTIYGVGLTSLSVMAVAYNSSYNCLLIWAAAIVDDFKESHLNRDRLKLAAQEFGRRN